MADKTPSDGKELTQEERDKAAQWVIAKWGPHGSPCPICKHTRWLVGQHLVASSIVSSGGHITLLGGPTYPFVQILCQNCGNTQFLNAVVMGIVKPLEKEPSPEETLVKTEGSSG